MTKATKAAIVKEHRKRDAKFKLNQRKQRNLDSDRYALALERLVRFCETMIHMGAVETPQSLQHEVDLALAALRNERQS